MVELNAVESDDEEDDDTEDCFKETVGVKRIIEALSCHSWSNMIMKDKPAFRSPYFQQLMNTAQLENSAAAEDEACTNCTSNCGNVADIKTESKASDNSSIASDNKTCSNDNKASSNDTDKSTDNPSTSNSKPSSVTESNAADASRKSSSTATNGEAKKISSQHVIDGLLGDMDSSEDGQEAFEKLFEKLQVMKESAGSMPATDRKKYAEQITLQFWQAIGGNQEEIEGLSEDDSEDDNDT